MNCFFARALEQSAVSCKTLSLFSLAGVQPEEEWQNARIENEAVSVSLCSQNERLKRNFNPDGRSSERMGIKNTTLLEQAVHL